jgi:signal transduction histidine kinase
VEQRTIYSKIVPLGVSALFLLNAGIAFAVRYTPPDAPIPFFIDAWPGESRLIFFVTFYASLAICAVSLAVVFLSRAFLLRGLCLMLSLATAVIGNYIIEDLFTIHFSVYTAHLIIIGTAFSPPKNYCAAAISLAFFMLCLYHPSFFGLPPNIKGFPSYTTPEITLLLSVSCMITTALMVIIAFSQKYENCCRMVDHLNETVTKMTLFNHRLQDYVKNEEEEVVKKDRLRFTSDLHDSCGYVFTNIIAMTDAAMSQPVTVPGIDAQKTQETFSLIQQQARDGLQKTRLILRSIREIQDPQASSVEMIFEMKKILEEITDIAVIIDTGNMKERDDSRLNFALTRIVQEAFTNSVRHGQATKIHISFWEFPETLEMIMRDNGKGSKYIVKGIGLAGMEERLGALGGKLEVYSPEDGGFVLKVAIPL